MANTSPWEGAICRAMKVGKEEVMGCLAAVEAWTQKDLNASEQAMGSRVRAIAALVETVPGVSTEIKIPGRWQSLSDAYGQHGIRRNGTSRSRTVIASFGTAIRESKCSRCQIRAWCRGD